MTQTPFNSAVPFYINVKEGFLKVNITYSAAETILEFLGHTKNMRAATAFYCTPEKVMDIARILMRQQGTSSAQYFAIVHPALLGFNKSREISA